MLLICTAGATIVTPAAARDSLAPVGAGDRWLPREQWVTHHWLPYDEHRLLRELRLSRGELLKWLGDDRHHQVSQLLHERGLRVGAVANYLVAPWSGRVERSQYARLRDRARRTLTQGHLAQHVFFHYLHQSEVTAHAVDVFGATPAEYHRLRAVGYTPTEIGALHGRPRRSIASAILSVCRLSAQAGVGTRETPARQAARFLRRQRSALSGYLDQVLHAPRRARLGLPPAARGTELSDYVVRLLAHASPRAASLLQSAALSTVASSPSTRAVYVNFTIWPPAMTVGGDFDPIALRG
jgi:hypothetical protein